MKTLRENHRKLNLLLALALIIGISGIVFAPLSYANNTAEEGITGIEEVNLAVDFIEGSLNNYLFTGVLEHSIAHDFISNHTMGTAYNPATNTYWIVGGGQLYSSCLIKEYQEDGTIVTDSTVPVDGRAIVYRPEDGNIYIASRGIYRLNLPFDGTVTLIHADILQDAQSGIAFANGGNIFDVNNGTVREYDFATGTVLRTFFLNTIYPSGTTYPYNVQIASDGTDLYFFSAVDDVYVYDNNGIYQNTVDLNHLSFDNFESPFSLSYANERIYIYSTVDCIMYGYRIKEEDSPEWGEAYNTLFDSPSYLELLRQYRDKVLSKTTKGEMYKTLLYMSSEEALEVLLDNSELMLEAKDLIEANKDAVSEVLNGNEGVIYNTDEIVSFLKAYAKKSPPDLELLAITVEKEMLRQQKKGGKFLGFRLK